MNKTVLEYLNGKANDVKDYIVAKAEAAGNYLSDHATDIKDGFVKGTATVLTVAAMLGGMTACDTNEPVENPNNTPGISAPANPSTPETNPSTPGQPGNPNDNKVTLRPREEIEQTGITAQDVLDLYDEFARDAIRAFHGFPGNPIHIDELTGNFISLSPQFIYHPETRDKIFTPCYIKENNFTPAHNWLTDSSHQLYNPNISDVGEVHIMTLYVNQDGIGKDDKYLKNFAIPATEFDKLMLAFNNSQFNITNEYVQDKNELLGLDKHIGKTAYNSIIFDKDLIANATEDQLWALYNAMESMYSINFYGELPQSNKDYTDLEIDSLLE